VCAGGVCASRVQTVLHCWGLLQIRVVGGGVACRWFCERVSSMLRCRSV
jgi:hypothetical protein